MPGSRVVAGDASREPVARRESPCNRARAAVKLSSRSVASTCDGSRMPGCKLFLESGMGLGLEFAVTDSSQSH